MNIKLITLTCALLIPALGWSATTPLKFKNIEGWRVESVESDANLRKIFEGSQYLFFTADESAEERPIVKVRELGDATKLKASDKESWRAILFPENGETRIVTQQTLLKGKPARYLAEFQTDTGTATMLHSIVLATVVNGKIQILTYEQRRDVYMKNIASIKKLFQSVIVQSER